MKVYLFFEQGGCGGCGDGRVIKVYNNKEKAFNDLKSKTTQWKEYNDMDETILIGDTYDYKTLEIQEFELE